MTERTFNERIDAGDLGKMPAEYRDLLVRLLTIQADSEIGGPNVYARRWCLDAPTADDMYRLTQIVAEEIGHYRMVADLLDDLDVDASPLLHRPSAQRYISAFREQSIPDWAEVAAFCCLIDRVGRYQVEELTDSSYRPLDRILPRILQEEIGHVGWGTARLSQLAATSTSRAAAQAAADRWYPRALDMFGRSGSARADRYIAWGLKRHTNEDARRAYVQEVGRVIERMGLHVPDELAGRQYL